MDRSLWLITNSPHRQVTVWVYLASVSPFVDSFAYGVPSKLGYIKLTAYDTDRSPA